MAINRVPEKFIATCDMCYLRKEGETPSLPTGWGAFKFTKVGRDYSGAVVGGYTHERIVCEECATSVLNFINNGNGKGK